MVRLKRKGIALKFTMGLVLTMVMVISAMYIFSNIFSYESEAKGHESFVRLVAMMEEVNGQPEGTSDSVLIRLPRDWAILGFDGTALEAIRVLNNGLVVHKRAYRPQECREFERCVCLVKNLDVAETIYWERTLRCEDLGESGRNIPISHFAHVGRTEYFTGEGQDFDVGGVTAGVRGVNFLFMWKGGFAILQSEDKWADVWDQSFDIEFPETHATSIGDDVLVAKIEGNKVSVCTNDETCSPTGIGGMNDRHNQAQENFRELERRWSSLLEQRAESIREEHIHDWASLMDNYDTFLETRDFIYLSQYQQDNLYTHRRLSAQYGHKWTQVIQYTDEAVRLVSNDMMRQTAETAQTNLSCENRDTLSRCRQGPPICDWIQDNCQLLENILIPEVDCSDRSNEADCRFASPRLCQWRASAVTVPVVRPARCSDAR